MPLKPVSRVPVALSLAVGLILLSTAAFAQAGKSPNVAGKYSGWARGSSQGDMTLAIVLVQKAGEVSGTMNAGDRFAFTIYDGKVEGNKLSFNFSDGEITGSVSAVFKDDGAMNGSWSANGETGAIELKKGAEK